MEDEKKTLTKTDQRLAKSSLSSIEKVLKNQQKSVKSIELTVTGDEARVTLPVKYLSICRKFCNPWQKERPFLSLIMTKN